jgi:hypothetical protein
MVMGAIGITEAELVELCGEVLPFTLEIMGV